MSDLRSELRAVGIRGRTARRILAETAAHDAEALGDPRELAAEFADALAPAASRRSAFATFVALVPAGIASLVAFATLPVSDLPSRAVLASGVAIVAGQVSFVAGVLAAVRALRRPKDVPVVARRAAVAAIAAAATLGALAVASGAWWELLVAALPLLLAAPAIARAARLHVARPRTDLADDLGFDVDPRVVALAAGALVALAAAVQGDPFDGLLNGVFESLACFGGYVTLGRTLGVRR